MSTQTTREPQYQDALDLKNRAGFQRLGLMTNQVWHDDPRRLGFILARYKFVAKMLAGRGRVAEAGAGDGFGARVVLQEVKEVVAFDFDPLFIEDMAARGEAHWPVTGRLHDLLDAPLPDGPYDAVYSLDVIEHIPPVQEHTFINNLKASLGPHGVLILGTPSLESQRYASKPSAIGHVNCHSGAPFKTLLEQHFHTVFL